MQFSGTLSCTRGTTSSQLALGQLRDGYFSRGPALRKAMAITKGLSHHGSASGLPQILGLVAMLQVWVLEQYGFNLALWKFGKEKPRVRSDFPLQMSPWSLPLSWFCSRRNLGSNLLCIDCYRHDLLPCVSMTTAGLGNTLSINGIEKTP